MSKSVPTAPWDTLFVFINIQCFFSGFISKVSCICQPQWKASDTTESRSRFNRFHAISTTCRGVCLPLAEETVSHTGGFLSSWWRPNPASLEWEKNEAAGFVPKHSSYSTCAWPQPVDVSCKLARGPDEVRYCLLSLEKIQQGVHAHTGSVQVTKTAFNKKRMGQSYEYH